MAEANAADHKWIAVALAFGATVFFLNDFALLISDFRWWLVVDYITRLAVIAFCMVGAVGRAVEPLYRPPPPLTGLLWTIALIASVKLDMTLLPVWGDSFRLFSYPTVTNPYWRFFDTSAGLGLVAVSEEVLTRGVFLAWARGRNWNPVIIIAASSLFFALMHWSLGLVSLTTAFVFGILAMGSVLATRSLWPALIGHWIVDVVLFTQP